MCYHYHLTPLISSNSTFKNRNNKAQIAADASNLQAAAIRDLAAVKKGLPKECKKQYALYAARISAITNEGYDTVLKKALDTSIRLKY